ncbi:MAG: hypothetical protein GZ094_20270 [Mariniphaga sp.]|nr:hypothetical protein [Mariniphaga sp.]
MIKFNLKDAKKIGDDLGINWDEVDPEEFAKGVNVELEHGKISPETNVTDNENNMTGKIAWAHLNEFPDYYTRLAKLEKEAREYWKKQ